MRDMSLGRSSLPLSKKLKKLISVVKKTKKFNVKVQSHLETITKKDNIYRNCINRNHKFQKFKYTFEVSLYSLESIKS